MTENERTMSAPFEFPVFTDEELNSDEQETSEEDKVWVHVQCIHAKLNVYNAQCLLICQFISNKAMEKLNNFESTIGDMSDDDLLDAVMKCCEYYKQHEYTPTALGLFVCNIIEKYFKNYEEDNKGVRKPAIELIAQGSTGDDTSDINLRLFIKIYHALNDDVILM